MNPMRQTAIVLLAGLAVVGPALAQEDERDARLEEARDRLEEAAREIAKLSGQIAADFTQEIHIGHRRAMLGINIGPEVFRQPGRLDKAVKGDGPLVVVGFPHFE